ncbi:MAG: phospho-sugar mutase [Halanaerobiales bacterium]
MSYKSKYHDWLISDYFDEETKEELRNIEGNEEEIEDRFYTDLKFGTGGMRGKIGAGTNRINKYTIHKATQGLANYIVNYSDSGQEQGVVIAYDSRHKSQEFATETALVLNGNGIKTYLFDDIRPTPELSFAVRELGAAAGVVITASHNPPEYNGYKVYSEDGGQIVPEKADKITAEIEEIDDFSIVRRMSKEEAEEKGLFNIISYEIDDRYMEEMMKVIPDRKLADEKGNKLNIIYTPLHGTGNASVRRALQELGFVNLKVVGEQTAPDPEFSTVESPNPEELASFEMALDKAAESEEDIDLILATDPDCDRMGLLVKHEDEFKALNGNEIGVLLGEYLLQRQKEKGELPDNGVIIKTIVTTEMIRKIANDFDIEVMDVLTGFKFIGEKIKEFKEKGNKEYIFGFEESYGYLAGTYARDKDAVIASALAAVLTLFYKEKGLTLVDRLYELREKYGYYREDLKAIRLEGKEGQEKINGIIATLRNNRPAELADKTVDVFKDYQQGKSIDCRTDKESEIKLPQSNVLQFLLEDETLLTIRPSGTEPKLKIYFAVKDESAKKANKKLKKVTDSVMNKVEGILQEL